MATTLDEVADLFLSLVSDYRLTTIYQNSGSSALNDYLEPWLMMSVDEFSSLCDQDLVYSSGSQVFSETLTQRNKNVLAQIMTRFWLQKEVQDVLQMNVFVQDKDFRTHAASSNLKEKRELYNAKREEISQLLIDYGYTRSVDWTAWANQNFT